MSPESDRYLARLWDHGTGDWSNDWFTVANAPDENVKIAPAIYDDGEGGFSPPSGLDPEMVQYAQDHSPHFLVPKGLTVDRAVLSSDGTEVHYIARQRGETQ